MCCRLSLLEDEGRIEIDARLGSNRVMMPGWLCHSLSRSSRKASLEPPGDISRKAIGLADEHAGGFGTSSASGTCPL